MLKKKMKETIEQNQSKESGGIYAILNKYSDRIYIGQTINFGKRWYLHQNSLSKGTHANKFLQNDFDKCFKELGYTDFLEFSIIEIVEDIKNKELLTEREQVYLDVFLLEGNCYNILKKAKVDDKSCFSKTPEETRIKKSLSLKKAFEDPEIRKKRSQHKKENWKNSEYQKKLSKINEKIWDKKLTVLRGILVSPDGVEIEIYNITRFSKTYKLCKSHISALLNSKINSHKGWTLKKQ